MVEAWANVSCTVNSSVGGGALRPARSFEPVAEIGKSRPHCHHKL